MFCYTSCFIVIYKVFIKKKTKKKSKQTQVIRLSICNYFKMEDFNNHLENIFIDLGPHFLFFRTYLVSVFGFFYFDIWPNFQAHFYTHSIITSRPFILKFNPKTHFLLLSSSTAVVTHYFPPPFPLRSHILFCFLSFPSSLHPPSHAATPLVCVATHRNIFALRPYLRQPQPRVTILHASVTPLPPTEPLMATTLLQAITAPSTIIFFHPWVSC